jgi:EAL domain-containing protein (putative c-di-GMP-specific phosphodiesterase class I)
MGRAMHIEVVAEGVETETQQAVLLQMQCDHYQGFLCAPGLPAQEFRAMLARPLPLNARGRRSSVQN